jgi:hypothetical protein
MCEFSLNLKHVSPEFLSRLVAKHSFYMETTPRVGERGGV